MNINVSIHPIVSTYSIVSMLEHQSVKQKLLKIIDETPSDNSNPDISKVDWAQGSHGDRPWIVLIKPIIDSYLKILGHANGYENATITDLWYQQYQKKDKHDWHIHGQQMVGVYYTELPEDCPITELVSPYLHNTKIVPNIKEGDILIFPSSIVHRAPLVKSGRKTIISWNFHWEQANTTTIDMINKL